MQVDHALTACGLMQPVYVLRDEQLDLAVGFELCERPMRVRLGRVAAQFRIGNELVGVCCDDCLAPAARTVLRIKRMAASQEDA